MTGARDLKTVKHKQIIDAAQAEFLEKGFTAARVDNISVRAGVSKRTIYKHFRSKDALFYAIVDVLSKRVKDTLDLTYTPERPIRDQLLDLGWAEGQLLISDDVIATFRMIVTETIRDPKLATGMQGKFDKTRCVEDFLTAAHRDGALDVPDPEAGAEQFIALLKARSFWPVIFGADILQEAEMRTIVENTVDMMMARYGRPDP